MQEVAIIRHSVHPFLLDPAAASFKAVADFLRGDVPMNFGKRVAGLSLLASFLLSTTALADVGPRDVWESWRGYLSGFGYDVSAQEKTDGNTLNVNDLTLGMQIPDEDGTVSIDMGDIQFVDNGDGTVDVVMPSQMPMHVVVDAD
ncbi:MAG: hypothetical protein ABJR08_05835, partial [Roseobacter sp.]